MRAAALIAALAVGGPALAQDAPPWAGVWTADPDWCRYADRIGSHSPAPVRLTATSFEGLENSCDISAVAAIGEMNAWSFQLGCMSEGSRYDETALIMLDGRDTLWRWFGVGEPVRFTRCPGG